MAEIIAAAKRAHYKGPSYSGGVTYSVSFSLVGGEQINTSVGVESSSLSIRGEIDSVGDYRIYERDLDPPLPPKLIQSIEYLLAPIDSVPRRRVIE
jgi:hypothetical protein